MTQNTTIRPARTVYPGNRPESFEDWTAYIQKSVHKKIVAENELVTAVQSVIDLSKQMEYSWITKTLEKALKNYLKSKNN